MSTPVLECLRAFHHHIERGWQARLVHAGVLASSLFLMDACSGDQGPPVLESSQAVRGISQARGHHRQHVRGAFRQWREDPAPSASPGQRIRRTSRISGDQHTQFARQLQPAAAQFISEWGCHRLCFYDLPDLRSLSYHSSLEPAMALRFPPSLTLGWPG